MFDVTKGSYDVAEIRELIGLCLLNWLSTVIGKSGIDLYRNDGVVARNNATGPKLDRIRKVIIALFKEEGLSIIIKTNPIETEFLDLIFNLATKKYFPFRKVNNTLLYINAFSKHPPTVIKQLAKIINNRISDLSYDKEGFDKVKSVYETAILKTLEEIETDRLYGSTHHIAKLWKQILISSSSILWINTSPRAVNIIRFST